MTSRTSRSPSFRNAPGFTLIEILLVTALLGLLVAIVMPNVNRSVRARGLDIGTQELASVIRYGRAEAMHRRISMRLEFNEGRTTYWLSAQDGSAAGADNFQKFGQALLGDERNLPKGVRVNRVLLDGQLLDGNFISFEPGGVSGSVVMELTDDLARSWYVELGPWYDEVHVTREEPESIAQ